MAANDIYFANPRSRETALGLQTGRGALWLDPAGRQTLPLQNGGIIDPKRFDIKPGTAIFSFTTVTTELKRMIGREWWVTRQELDQIIRFAETNNLSMGHAVRRLCCLPPEWGNKLNFLISARTMTGLKAWRGLANSAWRGQDESAVASSEIRSPAGYVVGSTNTYTPARNDIAAWQCPQLYIPGLKDLGATANIWLSLQGQYQLGDAATWLYTADGR